ncbi:MAG: gamma-glutamyl-gamma-aminobutyrate hydrolase family protein [Fibromonadales bacterium]|nr:gamma-glutamyl-gamma-aminobutyrate hydrolase family protein [Fibromonadales bacterium]
MKTIIGITQRVTVISSTGEKRDSLAQDWYPFLQALDIPWLVLPNNPEIALSVAKKFNINAFILSGGDDIGLFPERDKTETALLDLAKKEYSPVVGVCRGFQFICKWLGGELISTESEIHCAKRHTVKFADGNEREVNSYHNFSPDIKNTALHPLAYSVKDNSLEMAVCENMLGIMWHPERELKPNSEDLNFFKKHLLNFTK